jgi:putative phosphoesterase
MIVGVISDTHIPDRKRELHPGVIPFFRQAGVEAILHAGDVSVGRVLEELGRVAPVYAVRGNRDWVAMRQLPNALRLDFAGVKVGMAHGHGHLWNYAANRVEYMLHGFRIEMFLPRLLNAFPDVQVIVFGHIHRPVNRLVEGRLIFNPGSPHFPDGQEIKPSVGLLTIEAGGKATGEIVYL